MTPLARAYLRAYRATAIGLAALTALVVLAVPYLLTLNTQAATGWTAQWQSVSEVQADWQTVGAPCYSVTPGRLRLTCQSAGLVTRQSWSPLFPLTATVRVSATAYAGTRYYGSLALTDWASGDTRYGGLAVESGVPPFHTLPGHWLVGLVDDGAGGAPIYGEVTPATPYTLTVVYRPTAQGSRYTFYRGGTLLGGRNGQRVVDLRVFILCVSVGEATPDDGSAARCDFGPVSVTGILSSGVTNAYLPSVTRGGQGYP